MTTFTKEQLIAKLQHRLAVATKYPDLEEAQFDAAIFKIALASLEAEPVAYIFKHPAGRLFWALSDESNKGQSDVIPVYAAQPVSVVPNKWTIFNAVSFVAEFKPLSQEEAALLAWNACRAAMTSRLKGNGE